MKQKVVEIEGKLGNGGDRELRSDRGLLSCSTVIDGPEIHRERVPVLNGKGASVATRRKPRLPFPFDTLPEGWNQVMPRLVIAGIGFASSSSGRATLLTDGAAGGQQPAASQ